MHQIVQNLLFEYLNSVGLMQAAQGLRREFKNLTTKEGQFTTISSTNLHQRLIDHYDNGDRDSFFKLWRQNVPLDLRRQDIKYLKIEFYISLYFCLYPLFLAIGLTQSSNEYSKEEISKWYKSEIKYFKEYLDLYGVDFSQTTEFLSYYALSYVENPIVHTSFARLFTPEWIKEKRDTLIKFMLKELPERQTSRLEKIIAFYQKNSKIDISELWSKNESAIEVVSRSVIDPGDRSAIDPSDDNTFSRDKSQNLIHRDVSHTKSMNLNSPNEKLYEELQLIKDDFNNMREISIGLLD